MTPRTQLFGRGHAERLTAGRRTAGRRTVGRRTVGQGTRGYTVIELMLALALLAMGSAGIITMQRVTAQSNRHAKQLATATHIAEAWVDQLVADSSQWQKANEFANTTWLAANTNADWFRPVYSATRQWGFAFDLAGNPQQFAGDDTVFCSDVRFRWLYPENGPGSALLRAEVRVYWQRTPVAQLAIDLGNHPCGWTVQQITGSNGVMAHHFVYMSTAILRNDQ